MLSPRVNTVKVTSEYDEFLSFSSSSRCLISFLCPSARLPWHVPRVPCASVRACISFSGSPVFRSTCPALKRHPSYVSFRLSAHEHPLSSGAYALITISSSFPSSARGGQAKGGQTLILRNVASRCNYNVALRVHRSRTQHVRTIFKSTTVGGANCTYALLANCIFFCR